MKRKSIILFACLVALLATSAVAQIQKNTRPSLITVNELKLGYSFHCSLSYSLNDSTQDTTYVVMFRDNQYKQIVEIESFAHTGQLSDLVQLFSEQIGKEKGAEQSVKVGSDELHLITRTALGMKVLYIFKGRSYFSLTEPQVKKLFAFKK